MKPTRVMSKTSLCGSFSRIGVRYAEFDDVDGADVAETFATWRSECADARERAAAAPSLEITVIQDGREFSLR